MTQRELLFLFSGAIVASVTVMLIFFLFLLNSDMNKLWKLAEGCKQDYQCVAQIKEIQNKSKEQK